MNGVRTDGLKYRLLKTLEGISPLTCDTPSLVAEHGDGLNNPRQSVWNALIHLERDGLVTRTKSGRVTTWKTT